MGKLLTGVFIVLALLVMAGYWLSRAEPTPDPKPYLVEPRNIPAPRQPVIQRRALKPPEPRVVDNYALSGDLPSLDNSDDRLFDHLRLAVTPIPLGLLNNEQLLRKFVLQVDNAAKGELIYPHSPLVKPEGALAVKTTDTEQLYRIDEASYQRYDSYAELAETMSISLLVAYYGFYEPLLDSAYAELGYPENAFRARFITAIDQALSAPIVEGEVLLKQPEVNFLYADPSLEALNPLQKQFLRMGPENTQRIQAVLQQFKARIQ